MEIIRRMKQSILSNIILVSLLLLVSCDKNKDIKQFASDFAVAVKSRNKSEITKMYPDAAVADSLIFAYDAEKAEIEEVEGKGWKLTLGDNQFVIIERTEPNGALSIKESHGVFAFSKAQKEFGLKTGLLKADMSDATIAEQLSDTAFISYVSKNFLKTFKEKFRIKKVYDNRSDYASDWTGGGEWFVTIGNDLDIDVSGADYQVVISSPVQQDEKEILEGKDVYAGSQETLKSNHIEDTFYVDYSESIDSKDPKIKLEFILSDIDILNKYFVPKGDEYSNYLKQK